MRRRVEKVIHSLPLDAPARRALDETLNDWKYEEELAEGRFNWIADLRSAWSVLRTLLLVSWSRPRNAAVAGSFGAAHQGSARDEVLSVINGLSPDSSIDDILRELSALKNKGGEAATPAAPIVDAAQARRGRDAAFWGRTWKTAVFFLVCSALGGAMQTWLTKPEYMSTAIVRVESDDATGSTPSESQRMLTNVDPDVFIQTELSVLQSRDLKLRVVRKLGLSRNTDFLGSVGVSGGTGDLPNETRDETRAIDILAGHLAVVPRQTASLFAISYVSQSPELAATIANAFADEYVEQNLERKRATLDEKLRTVTTMLDETKAQIEAGQTLLLAQVTKANILDPDMVSRQLTLAQQEASNRIREQQAAEFKMNNLARLDPDKDLEAVMNHPEILPFVVNLRAALGEYRRQRTDLAARGFGPANAAMVQLERNIDGQITLITQEARRIINTAKTNYETAVAQAENAAREYRAAQQLQIENSRNGIPYQDLKEKIQSQIASRNQMLATQNDLMLLAKGIENNIRLIERAPVPRAPYKPNAARNLLVWVGAGLLLSVVSAGIQRGRSPGTPAFA